jgi:hypothetical protein
MGRKPGRKEGQKLKGLHFLKILYSFWSSPIRGGKMARYRVMLIVIGILANLAGLLINLIIIFGNSSPPYLGASLILVGTLLMMLGLHLGSLQRRLKGIRLHKKRTLC